MSHHRISSRRLIQNTLLLNSLASLKVFTQPTFQMHGEGYRLNVFHHNIFISVKITINYGGCLGFCMSLF